jgi:hypothetical protein
MQLTLIDVTQLPDKWTSDDWETPDDIARLLASRVHDGSDPCLPADRVIIDAGAGSGRITQFLPPGTHAIEGKASRVEAGRLRAPDAVWHHADFLTWAGVEDGTADLVIGNPPFSVAPEFINRGLELVKPGKGRVVFLLPCDTLHKPEATLSRIRHDFYHSTLSIPGRVGYLKAGKPVKTNRQVYDSIFTFRRWSGPNPDIAVL